MGILSHVACVYIATAASTRVASAQAIHQPGAFARHRASSSPSSCASGLGFIPRPLPRRCSTTTRAVRRSAKDEGHVYEVHPVAGDGRCLFRSVAIGMALRGSGGRDDVGTETARADALRNAAVDELERRRAEVEWFIEGDFDAYCVGMRRPNAWGGEPEILMLTHVVETPIEVFMPEAGKSLRSIGVYGGEEYCDEKDGEGRISVLFHGAGHYEALTRCDDE